ncbi:MAG TPA: F0F1 ATP synthase subunit [Methylophaga sp.]|nr:F0F1 ATP synthase subunit [Methylophaga sp.]
MNPKQRLQKQVDNQVKRIKKARQEQASILAQTLYLGTLGLVLILPVIGGAYLGLWLDSMAAGYSMRWTLSLLLLGLLFGAINVYLLIKEKD